MSINHDLNIARFNEEAVGWDANKKHVESVERAYDAIRQYVPAFREGEETKDLDVLEIGCGTGLLSFKLAPHVRSLVGLDTSDGMISAFNAKLPDPTKANLCAVNHILVSADDPKLQGACAALATERGEKPAPPYRFDLIVSHLTLHHIPSMPDIFATFMACLKHGCVLALTDYEDFGNEAIRFHPVDKRPGVERHGLKQAEIEQMLLGTGFNEVRVEKAFVLRKEVDKEGELPAREMGFPFLMCFGVKS